MRTIQIHSLVLFTVCYAVSPVIGNSSIEKKEVLGQFEKMTNSADWLCESSSYKTSPDKNYCARIKNDKVEIRGKKDELVFVAPVLPPRSESWSSSGKKVFVPICFDFGRIIQKMYWTQDSRYLLYCANDTFYKIDVLTKKREAVTLNMRCSNCAYSPKNNLVVVSGHELEEKYDNCKVVFLDSEKSKTLPGFLKISSVNELTWSPDGKRLAIVTSHGGWTCMNIYDSSAKKISEIWAVALSQIKWSADSQYIAGVYENRSVKIFSLKTLRPIQTVPFIERIKDFAWSKDGKSFLGENDDSESKAEKQEIWWNDDSKSPVITLNPENVTLDDENFFPTTPEQVYLELDRSTDFLEKVHLKMAQSMGQINSVIGGHKFDENIKKAARITGEFGRDYGPMGEYFNAHFNTRSKSFMISELIKGYGKHLQRSKF